MIERILSNGYFPQELPPPFQTKDLSMLISNELNNLQLPFIFDIRRPYISKHGRYNLARHGSLRRTLNIINPINYIQLVNLVNNEYREIELYLNRSSLSRSKPIFSTSDYRAFYREIPFDNLPVIRAQTRNGCRYLLKTDINTFYSSIYTHSIPWSLHTKLLSKSKRKYNDLLGNRLDTLIRNGQDQQTKGIPIGPDISFLIAEILLTNIDIDLHKYIGIDNKHGYRYIDDYELCFSTYSQAEAALSLLQELLLQYELQLNPNKTEILELPTRLEPKWVQEMRQFNFKGNTKTQQYNILHYFDYSIDIWKNNPNQATLKYCINKLSSLKIDNINWDLYENLLLSCAIADPGSLDIVIKQLKKYSNDGYNINKLKIRDVFIQIINEHAIYGHGSEVAWVLWGALILNIDIDDQSVCEKISRMIDPVIILLALDAKSKKLLNVDTNNWMTYMELPELSEPNWLVAYEASIKGWLQSKKDYITQSPGFLYLRDNQISFYNTNYSNAKSFNLSSPTIHYLMSSSGGYNE